jgi:hypothetical protein
MKKNNPHPDPNRALEDFVRRALEGHQAQADASVWQAIEHDQEPDNRRGRFRRRLRKWGGLVLVGLTLGGLGWLFFKQKNHDHHATPAATQHVAQAVPSGTPLPESVLSSADLLAAMPPESVATWRKPSWPCSKAQFEAESGIRFENPSTGTLVYIPANALVRADGTPVRGRVELQLREYRTVTEYLTAGIDLHYGDARGDYFFNSGGMFDLQVLQNGDRLQLAENQSSTVNFRPTNDLQNASLYYFDEATGRWEVRSTSAFGGDATPEGLPVAVSEQTAIRNNGGTLPTTCLPDPSYADMEHLAWVQPGVRSGYELAFERAKMPMWFQKNAGMSDSLIIVALERGNVRMVRHQDNFDLFFPEDANGLFKELTAFRNCFFQSNSDSLKSFSEADLRASWWRVSVAHERGNTCMVTFFGSQGMLQFYATLLPSGNDPNFNAEKVMAEYDRLKAERRAATLREITRWRQMLAVADAFKTEAEWCMSDGQWLAYFFENKSEMRRRYADLVEKQGIADQPEAARAAWQTWCTRVSSMNLDRYQGARLTAQGRAFDPRKTALQYTLRVSNFGLHNCDQIFRLGGQVRYTNTSFQTSDGQKVEPKQTMVLDKAGKLCFTMPQASQLVMTNNRQLDVVVTDRSGRIFHLSGSRYANLDRQQPIAVVQDVSAKVKTPQDWGRLLGLVR